MERRKRHQTVARRVFGSRFDAQRSRRSSLFTRQIDSTSTRAGPHRFGPALENRFVTRFAVLGTGMAGFGAGYALEAAGMPFVMYDRNAYYGGHTHSLCYDTGFVYDEGGHLSFTKHQHVKDILAENVKGEFEERRLRSEE